MVTHNRTRRTSKKKETILLTAEEMFLQKGIRSVTVENIVDEAKVSKATFYKYFRNKEDILEQVLLHVMDSIVIRYQRMVEQAKRHGMRKDLFLKLFDVNEYDRYYQSNYALEMLQDYPEIIKRLQTYSLEKVMPLFRELFRLAKADGLIRPDVNTDIFIIYTFLLRRMFVEQPQLPDHMNMKELSAQFLDLYLYGVIEKDSAPSPTGEPTPIKQELSQLIDQLDEQKQWSALDFLRYLVDQQEDRLSRRSPSDE